MFKDFGRRIQRDIKKRVDERVQANLALQTSGTKIQSTKLEVNVVQHPMQRYAVWFGGSMLTAVPGF